MVQFARSVISIHVVISCLARFSCTLIQVCAAVDERIGWFCLAVYCPPCWHKWKPRNLCLQAM